MTALELAGATRRYGSRVALHPTEWTVAPGTCVALVGPNGAGKSTLLRLAAGVLRPSAGAVRVCGRDVADPHAREALGYLPEDPALPPRESVASFLAFLARLSGVAPDPSVAEALGVPEQRIGALSRGQRQRVAIAQAVQHRPRLILLDEPLTGLDPDARARVLRVLRGALDGGAAIVAATHLLEAWAPLDPRVVHLRDGALA